MSNYKTDFESALKYIKQNEDLIVKFASELNDIEAIMVLTYWFKYSFDKTYEEHYKRMLGVWCSKLTIKHPTVICSGCPDGWCLGCAPIEPEEER